MRLNLLPRNDSFLPLFSRQANVVRDAARLLVTEAKSCDRNASSLAAEVLELEHRGDHLICEVQTALQKSFASTPEPEDARLLASRLDDVIDGIEESAYRIAAYRLSALPGSALRLCEIIEDCAGLIGQAVEHLGETLYSTQYSADINRLENEADGLVRSAVTDLFRCESDALVVLKLKEIYDFLEDTVDRCEDVAVMDPKIWTRKWPSLRWWAALKMEESQCPERARVTRPV